jgi:hypothetical protein
MNEKESIYGAFSPCFYVLIFADQMEPQCLQPLICNYIMMYIFHFAPECACFTRIANETSNTNLK